MVEHLLAKERVASSNLVFRSIGLGDVAKWQGRGLQNPHRRFESGRHLWGGWPIARLWYYRPLLLWAAKMRGRRWLIVEGSLGSWSGMESRRRARLSSGR